MLKIKSPLSFHRLPRIRSGFVLIALPLFIASCIMIAKEDSSVHAASTAGFQPGRIIDDAVFVNYNSMGPVDIQNFLNSKVPTCDTNGTQPASEFGRPDLTHAQYAAMMGWPGPPFICLKNYTENNLSAAQIIYNAAQQYQINPQVFIVLLQKEQGLVTDTWPEPWQYRTATGYGCPDSTPGVCDSSYYGFTNQINWAAKMYRAIMNSSPNWYTPYVLGNNYIQYNPSASCGGTTVNIVNHATQALYNYTPYQPNQAALNAGYGTGDSCSSYGNLHFYLYFNDWFGASILPNLPGCDEATNTTRSCIWHLYNPANNEQVQTSSVQTRDLLVTNLGYQYVGKDFFGNAVQLPGNIPVYRLTDTGGGTFLTTDTNEYNYLVSAGYKGNGVDFWADPPWANTGYSVYRMYNSATGQHVWTSDNQKHQYYLSIGFTDESIPFVSISPATQPAAPPQGRLLVYRFYIPQTHSHFWTESVPERDTMINAGYQYEGVAWFANASSTSTPVYRLYSPLINQHLYTADTNERNNLLNSGGVWQDEGISQYVLAASGSAPVYRLYAPSLQVHLWTSDSYERHVLISSGAWQDEGIAWYLP